MNPSIKSFTLIVSQALIMTLFFISCGKDSSQNQPIQVTADPVIEPISNCSIKFSADDSNETFLKKGYLVHKDCKIDTEEDLLKKIEMDLK